MYHTKKYITVVELEHLDDGLIAKVKTIANNNKEAYDVVSRRISLQGLQNIYRTTGQVYRCGEITIKDELHELIYGSAISLSKKMNTLLDEIKKELENLGYGENSG